MRVGVGVRVCLSDEAFDASIDRMRIRTSQFSQFKESKLVRAVHERTFLESRRQ